MIVVLMSRWLGRASRSLAREALQSDCTLCPSSGCSLKGLPDEYHCPECGSPYEIEQVKRTWSEYLADRAARDTF